MCGNVSLRSAEHDFPAAGNSDPLGRWSRVPAGDCARCLHYIFDSKIVFDNCRIVPERVPHPLAFPSQLRRRDGAASTTPRWHGFTRLTDSATTNPAGEASIKVARPAAPNGGGARVVCAALHLSIPAAIGSRSRYPFLQKKTTVHDTRASASRGYRCLIIGVSHLSHMTDICPLTDD